MASEKEHGNILVIVEAFGKTKLLEDRLRQLGMPDCKVMASLGYVKSNPPKLIPSEIGVDLTEQKYEARPDRQQIIDGLIKSAEEARRVFIATDDDQEGDVIAFDLYELLSAAGQEKKLYRARLRAMNDEEIISAFARDRVSREFVEPARKGIARRIIDRVIGAAFSERDLSAGRVQGDILLTMAKNKPAMGVFNFKGIIAGMEYKAQLPFHSVKELDEFTHIQSLFDEGFFGDVGQATPFVSPVSEPWGYKEALLNCSLELGLPIKTMEATLQESYERGFISYIRAKKGGYSKETIALLAELAENNRVSFDESALPVRAEDSEAHEALHPLSDELLLGRPLSIVPADQRVAVLIARNCLQTGQFHRGFERLVELNGVEIPMRYNNQSNLICWKPVVEAGAVHYTAEQTMVKFMIDHDLGRPSTVVSHTEKFLGRQLVDAHFMTTRQGRDWCERLTKKGFYAGMSRDIERVIDVMDTKEEPRHFVARLLDKLRFTDAVEKILVKPTSKSAENDNAAELD